MGYRIKSLVIILVSVFLFFFVYPSGFSKIFGLEFSFFKKVPPFRLGLDLLGGAHLVYQADLSNLVAGQESSDAMNGVRDVIERRVNIFGVSEPLVQVEGKDRLVVELAGISDISQAVKLIGETPFLQFKEERNENERDEILKSQENGQRLEEDPYFVDTLLTGKYLDGAKVVFGGGAHSSNLSGAQVSLDLNGEGAKIFKDLTEKNLNKRIGIYLDGLPISAPVVQTVIPDGHAVISGNFKLNDARELATRLNAGALPVPISLISQENVGASLGHESLTKSLRAGGYGLVLVVLFMILFYRLPGIASMAALLVYTVIVLSFYKIIPVTLTLAGVAGFILSLGIAVDANVLIFARMREEIKDGKPLNLAFGEGFRRAWFSIRDSHVATLIGAFVLYFFTTSIVKGFALTLGIGVLVSLFSAITVTRSFLGMFVGPKMENRKWLF